MCVLVGNLCDGPLDNGNFTRVYVFMVTSVSDALDRRPSVCFFTLIITRSTTPHTLLVPFK